MVWLQTMFYYGLITSNVLREVWLQAMFYVKFDYKQCFTEIFDYKQCLTRSLITSINLRKVWL